MEPTVKYNKAPDESTKVVPKVVTGNVTTRKKSVGKKFVDIFLAEDIGSVKEYILQDVVLPTIRDGIYDILQKGIDMLFYGKARAGQKKSGSFVSYNNYSSNSRPVASRPKSVNLVEDIILNSREDAEEVKDLLYEMLDKYHKVRVADLYDAIGKTGSYTDNYRGWVDLTGTYVQRVREGYLLNLPRCVELD